MLIFSFFPDPNPCADIFGFVVWVVVLALWGVGVLVLGLVVVGSFALEGWRCCLGLVAGWVCCGDGLVFGVGVLGAVFWWWRRARV